MAAPRGLEPAWHAPTHGRIPVSFQKIAEKLAQEGVSGIDDLPIGLIAKDKPERLQPLQEAYQLLVLEADQSSGHLSARLHDPAKNLDLHASRKQ
jgi:hypothetical protein